MKLLAISSLWGEQRIIKMWKKLFSNIGSLGYPGEPTQKTAHEELKARFYQEYGNDPFPEQINEIYEIKNPKVIIVGEVK